MEHVRAAVADRFGVTLRTEVRLVGFATADNGGRGPGDGDGDRATAA